MPSSAQPSDHPAIAASTPPGGSQEPSRWASIVTRIQEGENAAIEELYRTIHTGLRVLVARHIGYQDVDDRVHNGFMMTIRAIQSGQLRNPDCLMGFVRTVMLRQIQNHIQDQVVRREREVDAMQAESASASAGTQEEQLIRRQDVEIARQVLRSMKPRDREVLTRFYLREEPAEQIMADMGITPNQFRLLKSRAKQRFAELGRRKIQNRRRPAL